MRKSINLFLTLLFATFANAQNLQLAALPMVVSEMEAHNIYESETIGIANAKSKQFARYQQMISIATKEQLLDLATDYTNAVVRLYAYQALRERAIDIPKELQQKFNNDRTTVQSIEGCVANKYPLSKLAATPLSAKSQYSRQQFSPLQFASH